MTSTDEHNVEKKTPTEERLLARVRELEARLQASEASFDRLADSKIQTHCKRAATRSELQESVPEPIASELTARPPVQKRHIAVCTHCYEHRHRCDAGDPCLQCHRRGIRCVRAKCQHYRRGTCTRVGCTRWHEGDGKYENVENVGRILRGQSRKVRKPRKRLRKTEG